MHVAATYDGAILRVNVNGVERGRRSYSGGINTATSDVNIGRSAALGGASYSGFIDEVSIYNRALSETEINAIYQADTAGKCRYSVSGQLIDECGTAMPDITVEVQPPGGTFSRSTMTDERGNYTLGDLPAGGSYTVTPQLPAGTIGRFIPPDSTFINLSANQTAIFYYRSMLPNTCRHLVEYVSDMKWASEINAYGTVHRDTSCNVGDSEPGNPITLGGVVYRKGLGAHMYSEVVVNLRGLYSSFVSDVGIDDEVGANGAVIFKVVADGVELYNSGAMTGDSATQSINVDVTGREQIHLIVADANNDDRWDHADWANARLVR
jgi:hypothetical protein